MKHDPTDPQTWLARAKSNLRRAELGRQDEVIFYSQPGTVSCQMG